MPSFTIDPSIDQGALLQFQDNFLELAQQTKSRLGGSPATIYLPSKGKTNNMARMGRIELTEVSARNPNKQYGDYNLDNRQFNKRRFTRTIQIDAKDDINELIKDPSSDILRQLNNAKERVIDRVIAAAAVGDVLIGAPDSSPTSKSATDDGVVEVDASGGVDYSDIVAITQNFINNDLEMEDFRGTILALAGKENSDLMAITQFINNDYIKANPVDESYQSKVGLYGVT
ncbi:MAG: phage capsid protein, partial [Thermotogota bacterium]|nr:phage capsid protein [Thermotogota bacterium]